MVYPIGFLVGILSGLGYAAYSLMGRSATQRGLNPWTTVLYTFGFATVILLFLNLVPGNMIPGTASHIPDMFWLADNLLGWGILLLLAAGPTLLGFGLYNSSLVYLPASIANLVLTMEPVFTAAIAYILLGERLSFEQIIGSILIVVGVILLRLNEGRQVNGKQMEQYGI